MKNKGFGLIDVVVGSALLLIIMVGIFAVYQSLFKILTLSQEKIVAVGLANQRIEIIRNLSYQDVGTQGGVPSGEIPQTAYHEINGKTYTIKTNIIYIDDEFDELSPLDSTAADYKKARVEVLWNERNATSSVIQVANISPPNLESEITGGTLSMFINDRENGEIIPNAQISVINDQVDPSVYLSTVADDNGWFSLPGLEASDYYQIRVSKTDYDTHRTYSDSVFLDPEPEYSHAQARENDRTTRYFLISKASDITVKTVNISNQPIAFLPFSIEGGRMIGVYPGTENPVYSYDSNSATNASGERFFDDMSSGQYYLDISSSLYTVLYPELSEPINIESDSQQTVTITLAPINEPCLRLIVLDSSTENGLSEATVRLYDGEEYDKTSQTNEYGVAVFPFDEDELINGEYSLIVSKSGYSTFSGTQTINNFTERTISLNP